MYGRTVDVRLRLLPHVTSLLPFSPFIPNHVQFNHAPYGDRHVRSPVRHLRLLAPIRLHLRRPHPTRPAIHRRRREEMDRATPTRARTGEPVPVTPPEDTCAAARMATPA